MLEKSPIEVNAERSKIVQSQSYDYLVFLPPPLHYRGFFIQCKSMYLFGFDCCDNCLVDGI